MTDSCNDFIGTPLHEAKLQFQPENGAPIIMSALWSEAGHILVPTSDETEAAIASMPDGGDVDVTVSLTEAPDVQSDVGLDEERGFFATNNQVLVDWVAKQVPA